MKTSEKVKNLRKHLPVYVEAQRRFLKVCHQRGLAGVREVEELAAKSALDLTEKGILPDVEGLRGAAARRGGYFLSFVRHFLNPAPQVSDALEELTRKLSESAGRKSRRVCFFAHFRCSSLGFEDEMFTIFRITDGLDPEAFRDSVRQAKAEELFAQGRKAEAMQVLRNA